MMAIIADIIASVEPQQMVISRSGSTRTPCVRSNFSTIASRSGFAPQVMAYWLMSSEIACRAASLISAGAAKSGKPCERLTALCFIARRVISRMTDSVNCSAFADSMRRAICAMEDSGAVIELKSKVYGWWEEKQSKRKTANCIHCECCVGPLEAVATAVEGVGAPEP